MKLSDFLRWVYLNGGEAHLSSDDVYGLRVFFGKAKGNRRVISLVLDEKDFAVEKAAELDKLLADLVADATMLNGERGELAVPLEASS